MKTLVLIWLAFVTIAVVIIKTTKVGPTIMTISASQGWGVHTGDSLALIPIAIVIVMTVRYRRSRQRE